MLKFLVKFRVILVAGVMLFLGAGLFLEWRYGVFRVAPRIDRAILPEDANLVIVILPEKAPEFFRALVKEKSGYSVPAWLWESSIPYEMGMMFRRDNESERVEVHSYASLRRFGNGVKSSGLGDELSAIDSHIAWEPNELVSPSRGVLLATGSVNFDDAALDQVYLQWGETRRIVPKSISGDHLWELLFDNRAGGAYLSMASMMKAFDFEFSEKNMKIMFSSIQFVTTLRAYADISDDDILSIAIDLSIVPSARNRVGVGSMKGALDTGFEELGKRLQADYNITVEGSSEWNEFTVEYRYTIDHASVFVSQYLPDLADRLTK